MTEIITAQDLHKRLTATSTNGYAQHLDLPATLTGRLSGEPYDVTIRTIRPRRDNDSDLGEGSIVAHFHRQTSDPLEPVAYGERALEPTGLITLR